MFANLVAVLHDDVAAHRAIVAPVEAESAEVQCVVILLHESKVDVVRLFFPGGEVGVEVLDLETEAAFLDAQQLLLVERDTIVAHESADLTYSIGWFPISAIMIFGQSE